MENSSPSELQFQDQDDQRIESGKQLSTHDKTQPTTDAVMDVEVSSHDASIYSDLLPMPLVDSMAAHADDGGSGENTMISLGPAHKRRYVINRANPGSSTPHAKTNSRRACCNCRRLLVVCTLCFHDVQHSLTLDIVSEMQMVRQCWWKVRYLCSPRLAVCSEFPRTVEGKFTCCYERSLFLKIHH
jgi:hypothetical protein